MVLGEVIRPRARIIRSCAGEDRYRSPPVIAAVISLRCLRGARTPLKIDAKPGDVGRQVLRSSKRVHESQSLESEESWSAVDRRPYFENIYPRADRPTRGVANVNVAGRLFRRFAPRRRIYNPKHVPVTALQFTTSPVIRSPVIIPWI